MVLIALGGLMEGVFSLPIKFTPKWSWENIWGAGSLAALILVPWPLAFATVPHLRDVYSAAPYSAIVLALLFGAGWGAGGIFLGLGISYVGLSLGMSLIMGLVAIGGSVIPLLLQHRDQLLRQSGVVLLGGIVIMLFGLFFCTKAGKLKSTVDKSLSQNTNSSQTSFSIGLFYCVAAGLLSALVNFALIYGMPIAAPAVVRGLNRVTANNAVWALVFTANYVVNFVYCIAVATRKGTLHKFFAPSTSRYWLSATMMGLLWAGGIVVYGWGATILGAYGAIFGFPVMLIISILAGNVAGAVSGEWATAPSTAKRVMTLGVSVMALAIIVLGYSDYLIK